jgi:hypothetical protein
VSLDASSDLDVVLDVSNLQNAKDFDKIINPARYAHVKRRPGEYIYCSVRFNGRGATYYYRTEDESLTVGDHVLVPVGADRKQMDAEIVKVEYFSKNAVPYPAETIKWIIREN